MAGEAEIPGQTSQETAQTAAAVTTVPPDATVAARPDNLSESYWDAEKNAAKWDAVTKDLTEFATLRSENEARAAAIPKDGAYKYELPADIEVPEGVVRLPLADDPMLKAFQERVAAPLAKMGQPLTQEQVNQLVRFQSELNLQEAVRQRDMLAEIKTIGGDSEARRDLARRWLNANLAEKEAKILGYALNTKDGVLAVEKVIELSGGTKFVGQAGGDRVNPNAEIVDMIGKVPAMKIFDAAANVARN